jgi:hypothetical protein
VTICILKKGKGVAMTKNYKQFIIAMNKLKGER